MANILVFNCGSSSIKFTLVNPKLGESVVSGIIEALNTGKAYMSLKYQGAKLLDNKILLNDDYESAMSEIISQLKQIDGCIDSITGVGHRVVHGGEQFSKSEVITPRVIANIEACQELAPLHNPANLMGIKIAMQEFPKVKHIACFDTAFHQSMPKRAYIYPVPYSWYKEHKVRRYGFHGMSHKYVCMQAASLLGTDLSKSSFISAHLGNGCSAAAVKNGISVDTTMGLTPLEGLMMGTRSGNIDPSLIFYMSEKLEVTPEDVLRILNKNSGLLGVSEQSMDLRILEEKAANGHEQASLAIDLFCYILAKQIAGLIVALDSLDALIFTGGIGENSHIIRNKTLELLKVFNFKLDDNLNNNLSRGAAGNIAVGNSTPILVIPTNEELMIAREAADLI